MHPTDAATDPSGADTSCLQYAAGPYQYQERSIYRVMRLMASDWAIPGDLTSHALVQASTDKTLLSAYADRRPDNVLALMVVNRDPVNAYAATVHIGGFSPNPTADRLSFDSTNYGWENTTAPYHATPDIPPSSSSQGLSGNDFQTTFPPYSVVLIRMTDSTLPTNTPTMVPTVTPSWTPTPVICTQLLDGFESIGENGNLSGIHASRSVEDSTTAPPGAITQGCHDLRVAVTVADPWNDQILNLDGFVPTDWSQVAQVKLDLFVGPGLRTGANFSQLMLRADSAAGGQYYQPISNDHPDLVDGLNKDLTYDIQWTTGLIDATMPISRVMFIYANNSTAGTGDLRVDNLRLVFGCGVTPVGTATATATSTATKTLSPTPTSTPVASLTASATETWTPTDIWTATATASMTPTVTLTASPSATHTGTSTPTASMTPSASFTASPSATPTDTVTASLTPTPDCRGGHAAPVRVYPNPSAEKVVVRVQVSLCSKVDWVRIKVVSTAYRKVREVWLGPRDAGCLDIPIELRDDNGVLFADGLYGLVVETPLGRDFGRITVTH